MTSKILSQQSQARQIFYFVHKCLQHNSLGYRSRNGNKIYTEYIVLYIYRIYCCQILIRYNYYQSLWLQKVVIINRSSIRFVGGRKVFPMNEKSGGLWSCEDSRQGLHSAGWQVNRDSKDRTWLVSSNGITWSSTIVCSSSSSRWRMVGLMPLEFIGVNHTPFELSFFRAKLFRSQGRPRSCLQFISWLLLFNFSREVLVDEKCLEFRLLRKLVLLLATLSIVMMYRFVHSQ